MNEEKNFSAPYEMPKRPNPDLEAYQAKVYGNNQETINKKDELAALLDAELFDEDLFRKTADHYNTETEKSKGFEGQYTMIESIRGKHGILNVYHFRGSDSVKFGYGHFK